VELTVEQIGGEQRRMLQEIAGLLELAPEQVRQLLSTSSVTERPRGILPTLAHLVRDDFRRRRLMRNFQKQISQQGGSVQQLDRNVMNRIRSLAMQQISLTQQLRVLEQTQRILAYWHIAHRPFAVTALIAVLAHVIIVVLFGATWFYGSTS
jgi:hypothetical protein